MTYFGQRLLMVEVFAQLSIWGFDAVKLLQHDKIRRLRRQLEIVHLPFNLFMEIY